jgi:hypothetical protein
MHMSDVLFKGMALSTFGVTRLLARPRPQLYIMPHSTVQQRLLQILEHTVFTVKFVHCCTAICVCSYLMSASGCVVFFEQGSAAAIRRCCVS